MHERPAPRRADAWQLVQEHVTDQSLRRHMLAVETSPPRMH